MNMRLSDFRLLTFDTYGTLIDWETGILTAAGGLRAGRESANDDSAILQAFSHCESHHQIANPTKPYRYLLRDVYLSMAHELGCDVGDAQARAFGDSVPDWPAFTDVRDSLGYLRQHFLLATLTNCD